MTEALQADVSAGPTSDALTEQPEAARAVETKPQAEDPKPEAEPKKSADETRADTVKRAIEKTLKPEEPKTEAKPDPAPKAEAPQKAEDHAPEAKPQDVPADPKPTAFKDAPSRFDDAAKKEWDAVPEGVRGAIHRTVREMETGIEKSRPAAERYETTFRQFDDLARQHGVDAGQALANYVQLDQLLRRDMVSGLSEIVAAQGLKHPNGQPITLRDVAASIMGQAPNQTASRQDATIQQLQGHIRQLEQRLGGVSQHMQTQQQEAHRNAISDEWAAFAAENPRAAELEADMVEFLRKYPAGDQVSIRERLADAYAFASAKNPAPTAAHTGNLALAQTQEARQPDPAGRKSVSGAPHGEPQSSKSKLTRKEAIAKAMRSAGL